MYAVCCTEKTQKPSGTSKYRLHWRRNETSTVDTAFGSMVKTESKHSKTTTNATTQCMDLNKSIDCWAISMVPQWKLDCLVDRRFLVSNPQIMHSEYDDEDLNGLFKFTDIQQVAIYACKTPHCVTASVS